MELLKVLLTMTLFTSGLCAQTFQTRDKIDLKVRVNLTVSNGMFNYSYSLMNGVASEQSVYVFDLHLPYGVSVRDLNAPGSWKKVFFSKVPEIVRWHATVDRKSRHFKDLLGPGLAQSGFSFKSNSLPGILIYYSEGWAPPPVFEEGEATDSIPGYTDLTPYGPGVIGRTIGPVVAPDASGMKVLFDTLVSYKHQSVTLGWLRDDKTRKRDCDEMMKGRDWYRKGEFGKFRSWEPDESWDFDHDWNNGIVGVLDKRLDKAKLALGRRDSVHARRDLQIFVMEVEMLNNLSKKSEGRDQKREVRNQKPIMTSEAYALLKYNAEYLIDRLPEGHGKRGERRGKK